VEIKTSSLAGKRVYAESLLGAEHPRRIQEEALTSVSAALAAPA
jgi:hypothetical protein